MMLWICYTLKFTKHRDHFAQSVYIAVIVLGLTLPSFAFISIVLTLLDAALGRFALGIILILVSGLLGYGAVLVLGKLNVIYDFFHRMLEDRAFVTTLKAFAAWAQCYNWETCGPKIEGFFRKWRGLFGEMFIIGILYGLSGAAVALYTSFVRPPIRIVRKAKKVLNQSLIEDVQLQSVAEPCG
jgi:hypothetical protein